MGDRRIGQTQVSPPAKPGAYLNELRCGPGSVGIPEFPYQVGVTSYYTKAVCRSCFNPSSTHSAPSGFTSAIEDERF